ncbi:MAG: hypothetical protein JW982_09065 [Spirochaetes bacterium]|nr:hypothetical protein [Spirochaetota bacterium]
MNLNRLKTAESNFMDMYPGGFGNPVMEQIAKKHKPEKMRLMAQQLLNENLFADVENMTKNINKLICASSMVSVFEKPKFRDFTRDIDYKTKQILVEAHYDLIHGDQRKGFNLLVNLLEKYRLAKWTYVTACLFYYRPEKEIFIKPTTCKGVIRFFELEGLTYRPLPDYDFYVKYRKALNELKKQTSGLSDVDNGAFSGFLMMSLPEK